MNFAVVAINLLYACAGVLGTIGGMYLAFKVVDHLVPFDCGEELLKGNTAVGITVGSIFVGIGLVIGLGLN
ncbi:MAG: DUF350 domain-containing protein [Spirochaetaceae bacterium]|nr:DUF350 domain-containing protein [Spirochaetaceae bacterium]